MEPFKNLYNSKSLSEFATHIENSHQEFNKEEFLQEIIPKLAKLEMKDRVRLIANTLNSQLDMSFPKASKILLKSIKEDQIHSFMVWPISQFVEDYGINHLTASMQAMRKITTLFTAEFCIRPFLREYDQSVFETLMQWREDKNHHIRRLVSEGTRPNLPWGVKVDVINLNLERNIALIAPLRSDPSEYVRKSVANHLNDISRLDEKLFFKTIESFQETTPEVLKLIRHASRTLLKAGNTRALRLHGYKPAVKLTVDTKLRRKRINQGDSLPIRVQIQNTSTTSQKVLIEYIVGFLKKNGEHTRKVFRLKDCSIGPMGKLDIEKNISFKKVTTRTQYSGKHFLSIQINGKVFTENNFTLKV